jgi:hypothetical protein
MARNLCDRNFTRCFLSRQATSGSQKSVRPTAKPMKPGTLAAVVNTPIQPNMPVSNEPRSSKGRM